MSDRIRLDNLTDADLDQLYDQNDATYRERAHLVAHLAALHPSHIGNTDANLPDWAVVTIETPAGQMTWHIAERDMDLFTHVQPTNRICRSWDGHTTDEKYQRMRDLTEAAPSLLSLETVADQQAEHIKQLTTQLAKAEQGRRNLRGLLEHHRDQGSLGILRATRTRLARALKACTRYRAEIARLAARITTLEHVAEGNRRHVAAVVPELERAEARSEQAEAAIARVRALATRWAVLRTHGGAAYELRNALDEKPAETTPLAHQGTEQQVNHSAGVDEPAPGEQQPTT
ncbi:hypothetical protein ACFU98_10745 [Streptomyces sp. NPDC057575]|uniref:WDGH domain-containing protein n=1 Tax=unclassified Streptomyces TaxID=2593676 RepID=UPI0036AE99C4